MSWKGIASAVSGIVQPVANYFAEGRQIKAEKVIRKDELKKMSLEVNLERIRKGTAADIDMDNNANSRIRWADDLSFAIGTAIIAGCFFPPFVPAIQAGFVVLGTIPTWFLYGYGMMLISVWGYRRLVLPVIEIAIKNSLIGKKK